MSTLERSLDDSPSPRPTWWRAVIFRFAFSYWVLFCIPIIAMEIFGLEWIGKAITPGYDATLQWIGGAFGITSELSIADNGSGDRAGYFLFVLCTAILSLIVAVVWSLVDRRRAHDAQLRALLRVVIRYTLAFAMLVFGTTKLFVLQFPAPGTSRLLQRYGDSSPMGLLWTFMGASPAYVFFSGAAETLGAVLLLWRRTTTLGALVLTVVLTNVALLNFCYDVPVKLHSVHYLAMCVFLLLPDVGRLVNVLVLDRATQPRGPHPVLPKRWMRITRVSVKYGAIAILVVLNLKETLAERAMRRAFTNPAAWYAATWNVTGFTRDGVDVPPVLTDATRWKRVVFQSDGERSYLRWRFMTDSLGDLYRVAVDDSAPTMTATREGGEAKPALPPLVLHYTRVDVDHMRLEGTIGGALLAVTLERFDPGTLLLVSRGFHWINEVPFNR